MGIVSTKNIAIKISVVMTVRHPTSKAEETASSHELVPPENSKDAGASQGSWNKDEKLREVEHEQ